MTWQFLFYITIAFNAATGARILGVFPCQSASHMHVYTPLIRELANRGHHLTVISSFPQKAPHENLTEVIVPKTYHGLDENFKTIYDIRYPSLVAGLQSYWHLMTQSCKHFLSNDGVQHIIKDPTMKFDLVIVESLMHECFLGFVKRFNAHLIGIYPNRGTHWMWDIVGNTSPPSYVPSLDFGFSDKMTFVERAVNFLATTAFTVVRRTILLPKYNRLMQEYFNDTTLPYVSDIESNMSVLLLVHHSSLDYPRPLLPAIVEVGGLHLKEPSALPQGLQQYLDKAKHGVILFSFGTNLNSARIPDALRDIFVGVFSQLEQRVIWIWDQGSIEGLSNNVRLVKWIPQQDVLAHDNLVAIISHAGCLAVHEAAYSGKPMVNIPIFTDQFWNARIAEEKGFGIRIELDNVTKKSLTWALETVLLNPSYRDNAARASRRFHDELIPPLEKAVYWIEYVLRHNGAPHLRSAAVDLRWYQYLMLDCLGVILLLVTVVGVLFIWGLGALLARKQHQENNKKVKTS